MKKLFIILFFIPLLSIGQTYTNLGNQLQGEVVTAGVDTVFRINTGAWGYKQIKLGNITSGVTYSFTSPLINTANTISIQNASAAASGVVTTGAQTFAGIKTFTSSPVLSALSAGGIVKANAGGGLSLAVAGTDYVAPSSLNDYVTLNTNQTLNSMKTFSTGSGAYSTISPVGGFTTWSGPGGFTSFLSAGNFYLGRNSYNMTISSESQTTNQSVNFPDASGVIPLIYSTDQPYRTGFFSPSTGSPATAKKVFQLFYTGTSGSTYNSNFRFYINNTGTPGYKESTNLILRTWDDNAGGSETGNLFTFGGDGNMAASGNINASSFVKSGGTSSQFLKADGSVDGNSYATTSSLANYVTLNTEQSISAIKNFTNYTRNSQYSAYNSGGVFKYIGGGDYLNSGGSVNDLALRSDVGGNITFGNSGTVYAYINSGNGFFYSANNIQAQGQVIASGLGSSLVAPSGTAQLGALGGAGTRYVTTDNLGNLSATSSITLGSLATSTDANNFTFITRNNTTGDLEQIAPLNVFRADIYNPNIANVSGMTSVSPNSSHYQRIGNQVSVSGQFVVSGAVNTIVNIDLPFASNLTNFDDLSGSGSAFSSNALSVTLTADTSADKATCRIQSPGIMTNSVIFYNFMYTVK